MDEFKLKVQCQRLLRGEVDIVLASRPTREVTSLGPRAVFPGAFNPLHEGHRRMAEIASMMLAAPVEFEISVTNVDKPDLQPDEILTRVSQFDSEQTVWLSRADRFVGKSVIFPGATFVVGADTLSRIADARYYRHQISLRDAAIGELITRRCRFLVFGRAGPLGFQTLDDLELPPALREICDGVPGRRFRVDISSTELRSEQEGGFP